MISRLGRRRGLAGFTLIELLIVVIIIGILVAIGVPAYLRYTASANDRDAQSALRVAYKAAVAGDSEVNSSRFPVATTVVNDVKADEPAAAVARGDCYGTVANAPVKQVLVDPLSTASQITLCTRSGSGAIWRLSGPLTGNPTVTDGSTVALTMSGNEITDALRASAAQGDGLANDSSTGVWEGTTNLALWSNDMTKTATWVQVSGGLPGWTVSTVVGDSPGGAGASTEYNYTDATNGMAIRQNVAVAANTTYTYSFWVKLITATKLRVGVYDVTNSVDLAGPNIYTPAQGAWTKLTFTFTTGASTATAGIYMQRSTLGDPSYLGKWRAAWAQLEQKPYPTPYVPTAGASASRPAARVQMPAALLNPTQGWISLRARVNYSNAGINAAQGNFFFQWYDGTGGANDLALYIDSGNRWRFYRRALGAGPPADSNVQTLTAGDVVTLIAAWTATQTKISVNGGPFAAVANSSIPVIPTPTFDVGSKTSSPSWANSDLFWFACGTGTLSDSDAATINGWGSADPKRASFPPGAQATMVWDGAGAAGSLK